MQNVTQQRTHVPGVKDRNRHGNKPGGIMETAATGQTDTVVARIRSTSAAQCHQAVQTRALCSCVVALAYMLPVAFG